jgi:hydroxyacylglutathione hydrolase
MLLQRLYDTKLAQASYLLACQRTGQAIVVDPNRDVEQYARAAAAEGVRITHVAETHIHADFVSGARELAARTGATLLLSAEGGPAWQYAFADEAHARLLRDGDAVAVGTARLDVWHTPGHTPEHLTFLVTDGAATTTPLGALTGDFVFVGDVGRPDLLETAAGVRGTMEASARTLFRSLQRFKELPDHLQLWPGHGAGSACGKSLGAMPSSTLGYERLVNWGLVAADEDEFVRMVLAGQPEPPRYFAQMKRLNKEGPPTTGLPPRPAPLAIDGLAPALASGALVIDTRAAAAFAAGHAPGTVNVPLGRSFATWVGWIAGYGEPLFLVVDEDGCPGCAHDAAKALALIGLDDVAGAFDAAALGAWAAASGRPLGVVRQVALDEAARRVAGDAPVVLDVRAPAEWDAGHIPGAVTAPVGRLPAAVDGVARDAPIVVHCQGGSRSAIAASLLQRAGFTTDVNMAAGFGGGARAGHPTTT